MTRAGLYLLLAVPFVALAWRHSARARPWTVGTVPVAFWVWGNELPTENEVGRAKLVTGAGVLFVRVGQLHAEGGRVLRVRVPAGRFPQTIPIHLVYNGTRALLASFEQTQTNALAAAIETSYHADLKRARADGAGVAGLQLDLDVPTRLLPRYAELLRTLRPALPPGTQLSVTGLPTWMNSPALPALLDAVDFWTPQFYGARVPQTLAEIIPVSSPAVASDVARARALGRPFYAGLAAYGYAALYSKAGALVELRGDLDPGALAADPNLELVERRPFDPGATSAPATATAANSLTVSEWRYVFRARADMSIKGLFVREGERLLLDVPSAETLRASLRAAREGAGERLLGVCLFRLPSGDDPTALTLAQVAAALADRPAGDKTEVRLSRDAPASNARALMRGSKSLTYPIAAPANSLKGSSGDSEPGGVNTSLRLEVSNRGESDALLGDALRVIVGVPAGTFLGVTRMENFSDVETLCGDVAQGDALEPCGARRANAVRLTAHAWRPGALARAVLGIRGMLPKQLPVCASVRVSDGRAWQSSGQALIENQRGVHARP